MFHVSYLRESSFEIYNKGIFATKQYIIMK